MSNTARRCFRKCRAVVITTEGKRYLTPWRGTAHGAMSAARRLAERKNLVVAQIDSIFKAEGERQ